METAREVISRRVAAAAGRARALAAGTAVLTSRIFVMGAVGRAAVRAVLPRWRRPGLRPPR
ncbi:hypothetical protein [Amycolatopsis australiensis]|uniref:Uncharacterized protein n=1 Tax=Amycolatopsis australiensis TaxID=546364 RepID=A0A1K1S5J1_9PSEU|nr:hypothetical protein [Amycolatopsis australiensis]SFW79617.1 hypothetical protein SAMN04489730_4783 [Amycolatopsis australiensis]